MGDANSGELLALRRLQFVNKTSTKLTFEVPADAEVGSKRSLWVYLMSDSYIGLDQQYQVNFTVAEGDPVPDLGVEEETVDETPQTLEFDGPAPLDKKNDKGFWDD